MGFKTDITVKSSGRVGEISPLIYGSFIEHLGRCVYDGVYAPNTPAADENGFNRNVIEAYKEIKLPIVRYPGGSFVATWDWEKSIGPKNERKKALNLPWHEMEPSEFGIAEAWQWSKKVGCELMICLNLHTGSINDALNLVEYCNFPGGTYWSDLRRSHGYEEPFGIKYFSMGNEPEGWWQVNLETAERYARLSAECAKALKMFDTNIKTIGCTGFKGPWTEETLRQGYKHYDYLSFHWYSANKENNFPFYMAKTREYDGAIQRTVDTCDRIGKELEIDKRIDICLDEWNVWYHSIEADKKIAPWQYAPHKLEDEYNMEDALVIGEYLLSFMRKCERVKIGCISQLVNVLGPVMTDEKGNVLRQPTFYPYREASLYGRGVAITPEISCPTFSASEGEKEFKDLPLVDCMAVDTGEGISLFVINFSEKEQTECKIMLPEESGLGIASSTKLYHPDIKAVNTFSEPDNVIPSRLEAEICGDAVCATLEPHSWNMILLERK